MKKQLSLLFLLFSFGIFAQENYTVSGLEKEVQILVDQWGVPHIYAQTERDLFFAQGFYAARDRLFQFEIWRRQATGTVAEIFGENEIDRDIGGRLFMFRGDIQKEMQHYHPKGEMIINAFVDGINTYIEQALKKPESLPLEFKLLGIQPQKWTPEVVVSRHQGLLGNIGTELDIGRAVALLGPEKVKEIGWFHPKDPMLKLDPKIDKAFLQKDILKLYNAFRERIQFKPEYIVSDVRNNNYQEFRSLTLKDSLAWASVMKEEASNLGSNNWVVSGELTQSGFPIMANDPHRRLSVPSLRYMAHLVGPGWNVIGGGEPEIPGISIGHNEHGAWGLTVFRTDAEDLYIYRTNPDNPNQYWYKGHWEEMYVIKETIKVKDAPDVQVDLKYTKHGPVVFEEKSSNTAAAVRCGWLEIGGSPYLASLRMDQSRNFEEFRAACNYSHIPGENMIWADKNGNIGWQAVGIAPIRRNWSGLVPVPGDGSYEWEGYLPIIAKPNIYNPDNKYFSTANENVTPADYEYWDAIGFSWSDPYRGDRVKEFLGSGKIHSIADMAALQTDYLSLPARTLVPMLNPLQFDNPGVEQAKNMLLNWDYRMEPGSVAACIYHAWQLMIARDYNALVVPAVAEELITIQMKKVIDGLLFPDSKFGKNAVAGRDEFLKDALRNAVTFLIARLGPDASKWQYGQIDYKHVLIKHPLSNAVNDSLRNKLEVGPHPRGGGAFTANVSGNGLNQTHGATFRVIIDTGNWDQSLATNSPGQSGNPDHPHYNNLFDIWVNDQYFPLFYSKEKIQSVTDYQLKLVPEE